MKIIKRIIIITTEGCEACSYIQRIVAKAYNEKKPNDVFLEVYDFKEKEVETLVKDNNIKDFPTVLFTKNEKVIHKFCGTKTKDEIILKFKLFEDN